MDNLGNLLLPVCGFGVVCCGSVGILLFLAYRFLGFTLVFPAIQAITGLLDRGVGGDDDDDEGQITRRDIGRVEQISTTSRIKNRIQAADDAFEQALRSERGTPNVNDPRAGTRPADLGGTERWQSTLDRRRQSIEGDGGSSLRSRRDRRREDDDGEEVFGGALDGDFDNIPDIFE